MNYSRHIKEFNMHAYLDFKVVAAIDTHTEEERESETVKLK